MQTPYKTESAGCGIAILTLLLVIGLDFFLLELAGCFGAQ